MKHENVKVSSLLNDPRNVRKHSARNIEAVKNSLNKFGQQKPIVVQDDGTVIAGNATLQAARALGWDSIDIVRTTLIGEAATAFAIADNRTAELAMWDEAALHEQLKAITDADLLAAAGFDSKEFAKLVAVNEPEVVQDKVPEAPAEAITKPGDLWLLGRHRVLCGDSTKPNDVARLMDGKTAQLCHADPPYGMGKEADGVANDNLYASKLDAFQMAWWQTFRPYLVDNASAYIWGNAEDLWRLWYVGGLRDSKQVSLRNQLIWDKPPSGLGDGQNNSSMRSFGVKYESCLFLMLGDHQYNSNADNYWQGWEPIREYLSTEMDRCGGARNWKAALGNQMGGHYFTKSQWSFPTAEAYAKLQTYAAGKAFRRNYDELKREHDQIKQEHDRVKQSFYDSRSYFDNTHENMTDVWSFPRVVGDERHGHATPKPVAMMARCIKSSTASGGLVVEPFLGSGTTLIAAEQVGRACYGMELNPTYCDVIVKRWETLTGQRATLESASK